MAPRDKSNYLSSELTIIKDVQLN